MSGAALNTSETAAICRRASRPSNRSRMIARGRMPTAPAAAPCTRRKASSASIEGASAEPAAQSVKSARPTSMTGLRPNRSASGPTTSGAVEKPARKIAIAAAACAWGAWRSASTSARLGSAMSIDSGGRAESAARNSVKPSRWTLKRIRPARRRTESELGAPELIERACRNMSSPDREEAVRDGERDPTRPPPSAPPRHHPRIRHRC